MRRSTGCSSRFVDWLVGVDGWLFFAIMSWRRCCEVKEKRPVIEL
jgi:hypothetical protein